MAACPCCGDSLPRGMESDQLCPFCVQAMDTGVDGDPRRSPLSAECTLPSIDDGAPAGARAHAAPINRPTVVTLVACISFVYAVMSLIGALSSIWDLFSPAADRPNVDYAILEYLAGAAFYFVLGRGFWKLREWVRSGTLALAGLSLIAGGPTSD